MATETEEAGSHPRCKHDQIDTARDEAES